MYTLRRYLNYAWNILREWSKKVVASISSYYASHPKLKLASIIAGPPVLLTIVLILVVLIESPSKRTLRNIKNSEASEVYTADSVLLGRYFIQDRTEVQYDAIAPSVIDALISTEDIRFYDHEGIDFRSLGRVLVKSIILQDESSGGGSTLTQQLAKNLYPRKNYWVFSLLLNKLKEVTIAGRLEDIYDKKELINLYLNTVPFSDNTFGIESASQRFFSTSAHDLTIDQAAILIGSLKATHTYNPRLFPDRSLERRNVVLSQMVKDNRLDSALADSLKSLPVKLKYNNITHHEGLAPYFREFLKSELIAWCDRNKKADGSVYNLFTDGLKIYTTLDSRLQEFAEEAVVRQMRDIQKEFFNHWGSEKPWKGKESVLDDAIKRSARFVQLKKDGVEFDDIIKKLNEQQPMKVFSWEGIQEKAISPIDSIIHHLPYLQAGFVVMDPTTGGIKAWVGGINHDFFQYDHVKLSTKRQVGSVFKPIVYAMALENGIEPCNLISASQETYIDKEGKEWTPRNMQRDYEVEYTMRGALAYSVNTVAVKLIQQVGVDNTIELARTMGIISEIPDVPSIALGASSLSLLEMTTAYSCIANEGITNLPFFINFVVDRDGRVYHDFRPTNSGVRAMSVETAQSVRSLLQTVVQEGTASRLRWKYGVYSDVAGKTGTTQSNADGWFMGFTPDLVMGSWVGADDPRIRFRTTKLGQGSNTALPIAAYFLQQVNQDRIENKVSLSRFRPLPQSLQERLNCDLYELNDELQLEILKIIHERDSIRQADSLAILPDNFLETIYLRKIRLLERLKMDSINAVEVGRELQIDGG